MKFGRLGEVGFEIPALIENARAWDLRSAASDVSGDFLSGPELDRIYDAWQLGELAELQSFENMRVGAPIARPGKIVCIGLNYRDHVEETAASIPTEPVVFLKDPATIVGPYDEVLIPRRSVKTDWEVELGVVIGRKARYLESPESSRKHIAGYVLSHDVSEREFQIERGGLWDKGKSCETFNPLGPWLVTPDEIENVQSLSLRLWVNGTLQQDGSTASMIFPVDYLVWYLSQFMVLMPGDLINTGTPAGVAMGQPAPQSFLREGDVVVLEIDGLGRAAQTFGQA